MLALAASVVVAVTASWWVFGPGSWTTYSTQVGERRDITLADGSSLHLNTDTKIAVRLTAEARTVRLIHGEALFSVAHDALRPFRVRAAETVIQAIGTQFDVYRKQTSTRVAVIEGLVQISAAADPIPRFPSLSSGHPHGASGTPTGSVESPEVRTASQQVSHLLGAGQEAEVSAQGTLSRQEKADTAKDVSWRQGRLVFEDDTLGEIANEFNRYNVVVKIRVIGAAANNEHFSGTFDADAPEAIMQALAEDPTLEVKREGDEILIQGRNAAQEPATPMDRNDTR
jgi:transmembrane sensor